MINERLAQNHRYHATEKTLVGYGFIQNTKIMP